MPRKKKTCLTSRKGRDYKGRIRKPPRPNRARPIDEDEENDELLTANDPQNIAASHVGQNVPTGVRSFAGRDETERAPSPAKRPRVDVAGSSAPPGVETNDEQQNKGAPVHQQPANQIVVCSSNQGNSSFSDDDDIPLIKLVEKQLKIRVPSPSVVEDRTVKVPTQPQPLLHIPVEPGFAANSGVAVHMVPDINVAVYGELSDSSDDERTKIVRRLQISQQNKPDAGTSVIISDEECICAEPGPSFRICSAFFVDPEDLQMIVDMVQKDDDIFEGSVDPDFPDNEVVIVSDNDDDDDDDDAVDVPDEPDRPINRPGQIPGYLLATRRNDIDPHYAGRMSRICQHCQAKFFASEITTRGTYTKCCADNKVVLDPLPNHTAFLREMFEGETMLSQEFRRNIIAYNNAFQFASFEANLRDIPGRGPYVFAIQGQVYHHYTDINVNRQRQSFGPIYFLDPDEAAHQRMVNAEEYGNTRLKELMLRQIAEELRFYNPLARKYYHLRQIYEQQRREMAGRPFQLPRVCLEFVAHHRDRNVDREHDPPQAQEIAAVCEYNENREPNPNMRVFLRNQDTGLRQIDFDSPLCDALVFPLLFPRGTEGWNRNIALNIPPQQRDRSRQRVTLCQYYAHRLAYRDDDRVPHNFNVFNHSGRLLQKFIVGAYLKIEANRISYFRSHQDKLRAEEYDGLVDYLHHRGEREGVQVGRMVVLPSSFLMSPRSQMQRFQDAMAIMRKVGYPTLFITFTCNAKWPEITENLPPGDEPTNHPLLVCRVFHIKLKQLMADLVEQHVMGRCIAYLYVIEFQKRGLPHAHILITLANEDRPHDADRIDQLVSAEIPHPKNEEQLYKLVGLHMIHGPCGPQNPRSVCMVNDTCTKKFPKYWYNNTTIRDGRVNYRRRCNDRRIEIRRFNVSYRINNSFVVPYNPYLLMKYQSHINVEICANIGTVKYLYKYFFKSQDQIVLSVVQRQPRQNANEDDGQNDEEGRIDYDEIRSYLNGRYITPPEASWHILQFDMHGNSHHVERLQIHLPGRHQVIFRDGQEQQAANADVRTQLTQWFETNRNNDFARTLLYTEFPVHFVWNKNTKRWTHRQRGADKVVSRLVNISLRNGELYYLRLLLLHVRGATSFDDLKTVGDVVCDTFLEACSLRNLLAEDREWYRSLTEASLTKMPKQLRQMFAYILLFGTVNNAPDLWRDFQKFFIEDFVRRGRSHEEAVNAALRSIQFTLMVNGRRLLHFHLPEPPDFHFGAVREDDDVNQDINNVERERQQGDEMLGQLNDNQRAVFDTVLRAVLDDNQQERLFFVTGHAGTGKTFLYNTLILYLKGRGIGCLPVAWTGIAASLLRHGRTVHSTFQLPVPTVEGTRSNIPRQSETAQQIKNAKLLIWDEVSMATCTCFDLVEKTLKFLCDDQRPFGNKCVVLGGDFKQCLPVVPNGDRTMVIAACVKTSSLWRSFQNLRLETNVRVQDDQQDFVRWLDLLGKDELPTFRVGNRRNNTVVQILDGCVVVNTLDELIENVFGNLQPGDYPNKAILTPLNEDCHRINDKILLLKFAGVAEKVYPCVDSIVTDDPAEQDLFPVEFLNALQPSGFPPSQLTLKEGVIVMLLKNLNVRENLCNGTRMVIRKLRENSLQAQVIDFEGNLTRRIVFIPRIDFLSTGANLPFVLKRRQFPVRISYAMTINKAQGQTFNVVGIHLPNPVFDHGQLYVAFSRARTMQNVFVHIRDTNQQGRLFADHNNDPDGSRYRYTKNIVYREIL